MCTCLYVITKSIAVSFFSQKHLKCRFCGTPINHYTAYPAQQFRDDE